MTAKMWRVGLVVLLAGVACANAADERSAVVLPSDYITDTWGGGGYTAGWEFSPNENIVVTKLGLALALGDTYLQNAHTVLLYDASGAVLAETTFYPGDITRDTSDWYAYQPLESDCTLTAGQTYVIAFYAAGVQYDAEILKVAGEVFDSVISVKRTGLYDYTGADPKMPGTDGSANGFEFLTASFQFEIVPTTIPVLIDVKPGNFPNSVNINGNGIIPVAILGSEDFDVSWVNPETLIFAGLKVNVVGRSKLQVAIQDVAGPNNGPPDSYPDLVVHFVDDPTLWEVGDDSNAVLTGSLFDGMLIEGVDSVRVVSE